MVNSPQQVEAEGLGDLWLKIIFMHLNPIPDGPNMDQVQAIGAKQHIQHSAVVVEHPNEAK
jgi:hypothetical protein